MGVKERLLEYIKSQGISVLAFEKMCGLSNGYVSSISKGIGQEKLSDILSNSPNLNREWLLYGEGEMLRDGQTLQNVNKSTIVGGNVRGNGNNISNNDDLKGMIELQKGYQNMLIKSQSQIDTLIQQNKEQFDRMMSVIEKFSK